MKFIAKTIIIGLSLIFELGGRLLAVIASWLMGIAEMLLSWISNKKPL